MAVCGIDNDCVNLCLNKRIHTVEHVGGNAYAGCTEQSALGVLGCKRILDCLFNIFDGDKTFEVSFVIDDRKLLLTRCGKNLLGFFERYAFLTGNESLTRHGLADLLREIGLELQVAVCNDADQLASLGDRNTADAVLAHQFVRIL